jgi:hypothetical protein
VHLGVEREQPAALIGVAGERVVVLAGVRARDEMLAAILDPAEGLAKPTPISLPSGSPRAWRARTAS